MKQLSRFETRLLQVTVMIVMALGSSSFASAQCASKADDLEKIPAIKSLVERLGGVDRLWGTWEFGGVGFGIGRTSLQFSKDGSGALKGRIDTSDRVSVKICASGSNVSLQVPGRGNYQIRVPGRGVIQLAGQETGNKFYSFNYRGQTAQASGNYQVADATPRRPGSR